MNKRTATIATTSRRSKTAAPNPTPAGPPASPQRDLKPANMMSATTAPRTGDPEGAADAFCRALLHEKENRKACDERAQMIARAAEISVLSALAEFAEFVRHSGVEVEADDGGWLRSATFRMLSDLARARHYALALGKGGGTVLPDSEVEV